LLRAHTRAGASQLELRAINAPFWRSSACAKTKTMSASLASTTHVASACARRWRAAQCRHDYKSNRPRTSEYRSPPRAALAKTASACSCWRRKRSFLRLPSLLPLEHFAQMLRQRARRSRLMLARRPRYQIGDDRQVFVSGRKRWALSRGGKLVDRPASLRVVARRSRLLSAKALRHRAVELQVFDAALALAVQLLQLALHAVMAAAAAALKLTSEQIAALTSFSLKSSGRQVS
jgi:hypothetical protein